MSIQDKLEEAVREFGTDDERTLKASEARDKEVVEEQKMIYEAYKEANNVFTICN
ncbi:hypothetical protein [uncultured Clostridium sp.]|jgi:hypothetical protein|uniref:hypothetical protein n=1 Tax=uncultured Clostridium sp. TaxID=59620 RepID=UPI0025F3A6B7|nr:hypothetical protein [uncultured Clostridium sp.]